MMNLRQKKAVFFDFDGVLVDTPHLHYRAWKHAFSTFGGKVEKQTIFLNEGRRASEIVRILLKESGVTIPEDQIENVIKIKREYFYHIAHDEISSTVLRVLSELKKRGFVLALVTGCGRDTVQHFLNEGQRSWFDLIQTGDDVRMGKPEPECYEKALKRLKLTKDECVVVENAPLGIEAAKRAGICCVAVESTMDKKYLKGADYIIADIGGLLEMTLFKE